MFVKSLFLLLLSASAFAETRTYLVYREDNFPQNRYLLTISPKEFKTFSDTGKKTITEAGGQPFRMTSYNLNYNGKYALWTISFKDDDEKWHMDSMEKKGYMVLLSSGEVVSTYNPQKGGNVIEYIGSGELAKMPTDFYKVNTSTP